MNLKQILNTEKIAKLFHAKEKYGQLLLFSNKEIVVVFRPLTIQESEMLSQLYDKLNIVAVEDWVFSTCFILSNLELYHFLNKEKFGYVSHMSKLIIEKSIIQDEKEYKKSLFKAREKANTLQNIVEILITKGYSGMDFFSIKNMTQVKQFELLGNAEIITGEKIDLGERKTNNKNLRKFSPDATVIGGEDITSPEVADKPNFNEEF